MKRFTGVFLLLYFAAFGQNQNELSYNEFLGFVKKYHPLVKTANLNVSEAQANLLMSRGAFDPKIEVDYAKKQFKEKEYYSILNSSFKIPTWYGIELKAGFDNAEGIYLNPENTLPNQGLTSLGITIPLGQGLFINQRMADLRKAKIQVQLNEAQRKLEAIEVLYKASIAYFNWKKNYEEVQLYQNYLSAATTRFSGIKSLIFNGDKPAIDSVEAKIVVRNRTLSLEDSKLKLAKAKLELANYLWLENNIPLELQDNIVPEENLTNTIQETLRTNELLSSNFSIENHPKITGLQNKIEMLEVERKLKSNMLLPKIDLGYSYISEPSYFDNYQFNNYKVGVNFSFPVFLRKERGSLKLAKFKIQESQYLLDSEKLQINNKIKANQTEIESLTKQNQLITDLVSDNQTMLQSEERLFSFGESSLFLINSRENNLISAQISKINLENRFYVSNADYFKTISNPD
jgi:outer membrane protein TolC